MTSVRERLEREVIEAGICTGCGACVALDPARAARMVDTPLGPRPVFEPHGAELPELAWRACPGNGVDHPMLYRGHYGRLPENWLLGCARRVRTGYAGDPEVRRRGASGGVLSQVLIHLLETRAIDGAIVVRQGTPEPDKARVMIARSRSEIVAAAQSVYVPVSVLDVLSRLTPGEVYAMTCLPDQAASLRALQLAGHPAAKQIRHVLGPYTGTALVPAALRCYLRAKGVGDAEPIASLEWRAGDWPGYLEIRMASGKVLRSKKVYYNFLIPFFIAQQSLQEVDFTNEFCDLSVGDAWSPKLESEGGGHSVIVTRSEAMEWIVAEMSGGGLLVTEEVDPLEALEMHGHMLDFKKRGSFIRNRWRVLLGKRAPSFGLRPERIPVLRFATELMISGLFLVARTRLARKLVEHVPEEIIGPLFDRLRLAWKAASKPTKRRGLADLRMVVLDRGR
jgi:coenzyme F420 hydrogenase subunit beta